MSTKNPYERFRGNDLILRDELAIDRAILANERTVLACVPFGVVVGIFGYVRYRKMDKAIRDVRSSLIQQANKPNAEQRSAGNTDKPRA